MVIFQYTYSDFGLNFVVILSEEHFLSGWLKYAAFQSWLAEAACIERRSISPVGREFTPGGDEDDNELLNPPVANEENMKRTPGTS